MVCICESSNKAFECQKEFHDIENHSQPPAQVRKTEGVRSSCCGSSLTLLQLLLDVPRLVGGGEFDRIFEPGSNSLQFGLCDMAE